MSETHEVFKSAVAEVYFGDAIAVLDKHVPDASIDLIFADPPYNIGKRFGDSHDRWPSDDAYATWCFEWIDLCLQKLKRSGSFYLMSSTQAMPRLDIYLRKRRLSCRVSYGTTTAQEFRRSGISDRSTNRFYSALRTLRNTSLTRTTSKLKLEQAPLAV